MAPAQEKYSEESSLDAAVAAVEAARLEGHSVSTACRAAGISTSTYYRRRRRSAPLATLAGAALDASLDDAETLAAAITPRTGWPFSAETPRAPFFWDRAFADELSDSFVRRTFGAGEASRKEHGALAAIDIATAAPPRRSVWRRRVRAIRRLFPADHAVFALLILAALTAMTGLAVSSAADPAAWLRPADFALFGPPAP